METRSLKKRKYGDYAKVIESLSADSANSTNIETRGSKKQRLEKVEKMKKLISEKNVFMINNQEFVNKSVTLVNEENAACRLPDEVLQHLYKFLPVEDITNCQYVCKRWYDAAQEQNVWKGKPLIIKSNAGENEHLKCLVNAPLLQGVVIDRSSGKSAMEVIEVIDDVILHIPDLKGIEVSYPLPLGCIKKIVKKYPNLAIVSFEVFKEESLKALSTLETCKKLTKLKLYYCDILPSPLESKFCEMLKNKFTSLTYIDLEDSLLSDEHVNAILEVKKNQLQCLALCYSEHNSLAFFSILSTCSHLKLILSVTGTAQFQLQNLVNLRSVDISFKCSSSQKVIESFLLLQENFLMENMEALSTRYRNKHIVKKIASSFPNLRSLSLLKMQNENVEDIGEEVHWLEDMPKLKAVKLCVPKLKPRDEFRVLKSFNLQNLVFPGPGSISDIPIRDFFQLYRGWTGFAQPRI